MNQTAVCKHVYRQYFGIVGLILLGAIVSVPLATAADPARPASGRTATDGAKTPISEVVAEVNGEQISRAELAQQCLREHGKTILEGLVNKYLIMIECERLGITVTSEEIRKEIHRTASSYNIPVDEWLNMLQRERGIDPDQYANELIWQTLALRKLAADHLNVTDDEIQKAYQAKYGPAVQPRMIVCDSADHAQDVLQRVQADPESFGDIAKNESVDLPSAASKGLIYPIRRHAGPKAIEDAVFALEEGRISGIVQVANQYYIFKCERRYPGLDVAMTPQLLGNIAAELRDRKLREVAETVFSRLQEAAKVENVMNDPMRSAQLPGVAALVNGRQITLQDLMRVCLERHGETVLTDMVHRRLLAQECKNRSIAITQQDVHDEIRRAAEMMLPPAEDGTPNVAGWIELVTSQQGVTEDVYVSNVVWPSVALKKLVGDSVSVTEDDIKKGFESNYGPRVRVLAIVLNNQRRALEVFDKARDNPTPENFGDLAVEYSIESASRANRGLVPPIQKHCGQPMLEREAFSLTEGEISAPIQVDVERFVILYCLGRTEPVDVDIREVEQYIREDVREKKLRIEMVGFFDRLVANAAIDNYLSGESQSPSRLPIGTVARPAGAGNPLR